jgi:general secretion pathway protein F
MLKSGLPLEGALAELSRDLQRGALKDETIRLEKDLSQGTHLADAIQKGSFPPLYKKLLSIGARSGQLNEILILMADHYHRSSLIWNRLKGIIVYPILVLLTAFGVSLFLAFSFIDLYETLIGDLNVFMLPSHPPLFMTSLIMLSPTVYALLLITIFAILLVPKLRESVRYRFPGLHEASLAQTAATGAILLKGGVSLSDTFDMMEQIESNSRIKRDLNQWRRQVAAGESKFTAIAEKGHSFPPLFIWIIASSGEALADGFDKAALLYQRRADYRSELFMVAAVPVSLIFTLALVLLQVYPMIRAVGTTLNLLVSF